MFDIYLFLNKSTKKIRANIAKKSPIRQTQKVPRNILVTEDFSRKRRRPTLPLLRSTIGVTGLNFSVRNGKRWNPGAVAT